VRLLSKLRQRIVRFDNERPRHRLSSSKRLVEDVKFHVAARRVPRRDTPAGMCVSTLLEGTEEQRIAAAILLEVIEQHLPKLQQMSGFQRRALDAILQVVELDEARGAERGVVVTASTGAGKTYAFFAPILAKMILDRCLRGQAGVKAICIYPRVALSENQLTDFVEALFYLNTVLVQRGLPALTIGLESGAAVYRSSDFQRTDAKRRSTLAGRGWIFDEGIGGTSHPSRIVLALWGNHVT
jgi:hypothetical protein